MLHSLRSLSSLLGTALLAATTLVLTSQSTQAHQHDYFQATLNGANVVPSSGSPATGLAVFTNGGGTTLRYHVTFSGLTGTQLALNIHGPAPAGSSAPVLYSLPLGSPVTGSQTIVSGDVPSLHGNLLYISVTTDLFPGGEIRGQILDQHAPHWTNYCVGDGSGSACPCGNNAPAGFTGGCLNSFGGAAFLSGHGAPSMLLDFVEIEVEGLPPTAVTVLLQGTARANGGLGTPFGDGLMCVAGTVTRMGVVQASGGLAVFPDGSGPSLSVLGGVSPGDVRRYQAWYRNPVSFCQPDGFNLSEGFEVTWQM